MAKINVINHIHATNEFGNPEYDMTSEPWGVQYADKTVTTKVSADDLFPDGDDNLHWFGIPRPKGVGDQHRLVHVDYDGKQVDAYWQDVREFDHLILDQ